MKILITGTRGLAHALGRVYANDTVTLISKSTGFDINAIDTWGKDFLNYDCVFNCAYDNFAQIAVLEYFYNAWNDNTAKTIVTIGSKAVSGDSSDKNLKNSYWPYRLHKQSLQQAHDAMSRSTKCNMKIINPGPIDTDMIKHLDVAKFDPYDLALKIKHWAADISIKRVDLWL
jgi:hypothetical protein